MPTTTQHLCYNCFSQRENPEGPCPYCGFDLEENVKKFPVALRAGTVLNDRYIVGRVLGQGGFGITYLAYDTQLQTKVAVKEYMPGDLATRVEGTTVAAFAGTKSEDFAYGAERFREEARTLAKFMGHPNIAGVSSYFDENDTSYFVMDYIEGVSFKSYIGNNGGTVSVDETLNVMVPVLRALTAVHAEGFVHRDVTPDNIYISKDGNVKLLDFGSARYSIGDKSKSLDVILKVGYAPKEQYTRRGRQGPYTDVYSCAACFYAALTGVLPPESLERLDHDELTPVSQVLPDIPVWLDRAILKGLAVQQEDRFQSAAEFLDAVENQIAVEAPGAAAPVQPVQKKRRSPLWFAAAALAVAAAVGAGVFLGGGTGGQPQNGARVTQGQQMPTMRNQSVQEPVPTVTLGGRQFPIDSREIKIPADVRWTQADIDNLGQLTAVTELKLTLNDGITDLSPLADLSELRSLKLRHESQSGVVDLSFLTGLTGLEELDIGDLYFPGGMEALSDLTDLRTLRLFGEIGNVSVPSFSGMTELEELYIGDWSGWNSGRDAGWKVSASDLTGLTKLKTLHLQGINQTDLAGLETLAGLEELGVCVARGADLTPLARLSRLQTLNLLWNHWDDEALAFLDMGPLSGLTQLHDLSVSFISGELSFLSSLTELRTLTLDGVGSGANPDLTPLTAITRLETLNIGGFVPDEGLDLSPLAGMDSIQTASFSTVRVSSWAPVEHIPNVEKNDILD
jgi:hypothetical protein